VQALTESLRVPKEQLLEKLSQTVEDLKTAQRKLASLAASELRTQIPEIISASKEISGLRVAYKALGDTESADQVRDLTVALASALEAEAAVVIVSAVVLGKIVLLVATTSLAREKGAASGKLVKIASEILGGGGGGKDTLAQGGGPNMAELPKAISAIEASLSS
jgi:alanyl-tRNA synthetase